MKSNHPFRASNVLRALLILLFMTIPVQWTAAQLALTTPRTTLGTVIKKIQSQSKYQFFYDDKLSAASVDPLKVKDASLQEVLNLVLKGKNITFKVEDNIVYLSEKSSTPTNNNQQQKGKERKVTGRVLDEQGEPLIGVNVLIKGSSSGVITDLEGNYTLATKEENPVLQFSYIGYKSQELPLKSQSVINLTMQNDTQVIDEVVVTALGIKRASKALSYNVQQVSEEELLKNKDANFINALSGKVAGVTINSSSSGVGGASKVVMRGTKGIDQSSNALYVIDGVPMFNLAGEGGKEFDSAGSTEAIADINPEDIESMSVLTGAAAAALYGSHAANGAIVITTKKGKAGHTSLTVSQSTEFLKPFVSPQFQNRYGTGSLLSNVAVLDKSWGNRLNDSNYMGYSPNENYLKTGVVATETVSFSTGTERNQTYLSASFVNSIGMIPNNKYDRYNFTFRNTTSFLKEKMLLDVGASYINQSDQNMTNQGTYSNPLVAAYLFPRGDDWNDIKMYERYDSQRKISTQYFPQGLNEFTGQNPYWINYRNLRENSKDRYMLNANLSYEILDWLSISGRVRIDNSMNDYTEKLYATSHTVLTEGSNNGLYGITTTQDKQTYGDVLLNINKTFKDVLSLHANVGASLSDMKQNVLKNRGPIREDGLPNLFNVYQLDNLKTKREQTGWREQTQSIFASVELGYKSTYYLTLTGRNDWPSQLAGPNSVSKSFFYPSVGTSFIVSEMVKMPKQISYLKVRASFASVGLPFARFLAAPTYKWDNDNGQWDDKKIYPMYELKPERTDSWEVGLTARFLKHFNADFSFYSTKTYNQTFDPQISVSSGYSKMYLQTGSVRNQGFELSLGYQNTWNNAFKWSSNYTFSANKNEILELVDNYVHPETGAIINKDRLDVGGLARAHFILKKGGTLGDLYSSADLQRDSNGNVYIDQNGNIAVNDNVGDIKLGTVFPKCNMAWRNDFSWKGINVGFMVSARIGGIVYSATQAAMDLYGVSEVSATARDNGGVWANGGDLINAEKWYTAVGGSTGIPQYYTYSATNLRLQEASIGYTIPRNKVLGVADITVSLVGRNLLMIYNKAPFDPESVASTGNYYQGIDNFMMPSTRNLGFNVRLKF
ncbi:TonB-dependent receptor [Bacteroides sp.]|uniref:TonB-dependent receptor n=1 Tax=Bacteroides sp. TaxID=29523 RepID=UPI001B4A11A4|nr:TonB-dependent receptor [Bacteroides sp.]MBP6065410.1 TonB-dependent receptor [Bacteroides sp.]MBP6067511.1 TonB-dependent receptor [Bacteroides sp.]MBP6937466.1 TonB-dependent receptor [Bacteroides sp.]MBP8621851.1 TonB-dependent receptor [Bacteroides sp.]MBP9586163.1 TonB-dependent receptor [Bacteroides sp.]